MRIAVLRVRYATVDGWPWTTGGSRPSPKRMAVGNMPRGSICQ
jgi:hypothetical protein